MAFAFKSMMDNDILASYIGCDRQRECPHEELGPQQTTSFSRKKTVSFKLEQFSAILYAW